MTTAKSEGAEGAVGASLNVHRVLRPLVLPGGRITYISLPECGCGALQRGPAGGVCGRCGDAISDEAQGTATKSPSVESEPAK